MLMARGIAVLQTFQSPTMELKHQGRRPFDGMSNSDCRFATRRRGNCFKFAGSGTTEKKEQLLPAW
jgi:hypothetical protein